MWTVIHKHKGSQDSEQSEYGKGTFSKRRAKSPFLEILVDSCQLSLGSGGTMRQILMARAPLRSFHCVYVKWKDLAFLLGNMMQDRLPCPTLNCRSRTKSTSRKSMTEQSFTIMSLNLQCIMYTTQAWDSVTFQHTNLSPMSFAFLPMTYTDTQTLAPTAHQP